MSKYISINNSGTGGGFVGPTGKNLINAETVSVVRPDSTGSDEVILNWTANYDLALGKPQFYKFTLSPASQENKKAVVDAIQKTIENALTTNGPCALEVSLPAGVTITKAFVTHVE